MSTTCLYSDIVLPTATWYEKNDLNTSDMHPFIHPLSTAVDPAWQSRSDWDIYKGFAKKFSEVCVGHLGVEQELVLTPLMHDTPGDPSVGLPLGLLAVGIAMGSVVGRYHYAADALAGAALALLGFVISRAV